MLEVTETFPKKNHTQITYKKSKPMSTSVIKSTDKIVFYITITSLKKYRETVPLR